MKSELFPGDKLRKLIIPLIMDQLLMVLVGMAGTVMVASVGETAVSGVSLVDTLNTLVITLLTGLSTGGAVLCAHYMGSNNKDEAANVLKHMLIIGLGVSVCFMGVFSLGGRGLLGIIFGQVEETVLDNASVYFKIVTLSFPFLGIYTGCTAVLRGTGNSRLPMIVSAIMNGINIAGNAILLYGLGLGVEGVAIPALVSRIAAAVIMLAILCRPGLEVQINNIKVRWNKDIITRILRVGIPGSLEMSIFQIGKILVLGLIARLGTTAITANAIGNTLNSFQALPEDAIGLALITVVGACLGAGEKEQAVQYTRKLLKMAYVSMWVINILVFAGAPVIARFFALSAETAGAAIHIIRFNCLFAITIWPLAFALPNALKGAYDVKYPLLVSLFSMWVFRVGLSYLAVTFFDASIYMLYVCFALDWIFRAIMFGGRFLSKKWLC